MINRLFKIVQSINASMQNQISESDKDIDAYPEVTLRSNGDLYYVMFADIVLFSNDGADYSDVSDEHLESFLKLQLQEIFQTLGSITF
jgi:hypothetical protein